MFSVLEGQLKGVADRISDWQNVVIAYEPVWAIGTGKVGCGGKRAQETLQTGIVRAACGQVYISCCSGHEISSCVLADTGGH